MKGYLTKLGNLRKEGKLNDELQAEIKAEYEQQEREIRKRLNEQFPNKFVYLNTYKIQLKYITK